MVNPVLDTGSLGAMREAEDRAIRQEDVDALIGEQIKLHDLDGVEIAFRGECRIEFSLGKP